MLLLVFHHYIIRFLFYIFVLYFYNFILLTKILDMKGMQLYCEMNDIDRSQATESDPIIFIIHFLSLGSILVE